MASNPQNPCRLEAVRDKLLHATTSETVTVNNCMLNVAQHDLPLGIGSERTRDLITVRMSLQVQKTRAIGRRAAVQRRHADDRDVASHHDARGLRSNAVHTHLDEWFGARLGRIATTG